MMTPESTGGGQEVNMGEWMWVCGCVDVYGEGETVEVDLGWFLYTVPQTAHL